MVTNNFKKKISTRNACKVCTPLGACIAFRGIRNTIPLIHGGQGCATYMRRYIISHFREPMDIASSNFSEETTIFGGEANLEKALNNVIRQYNPEMIGVATSCLSETIGEDINLFLSKYNKCNVSNTKIVAVSTPSYKGTHLNGYYKAIYETVRSIALTGEKKSLINVISGFFSPEDLRHLKEIFENYKNKFILLPDYSETLDSENWTEYKKISDGGVPIIDIEKMGAAMATLEMSQTCDNSESSGYYLENTFGIPNYRTGYPIGINATDNLFKILENLTGIKTPKKYKMERGRLVDSYVDGHKYLFDKKAVVYGDEDLVIGITGFLLEVGIKPVLCASGGESGKLKTFVNSLPRNFIEEINVRDGADFAEIEEEIRDLNPDILIGNSKGYQIARRFQIPLVRVGFPIHDRVGGQRILTIGYKGTQYLFDTITNAIIENEQNKSKVGYSYI